MKMKINILCIVFIFVAGFSFAQKKNVTDAAMLMKKYSPMAGAEKAKETATKAKEFIDLAANNAETKEDAKMHLYRGMVYFALIEVAQFEAMAGKVPDEAVLEGYKEISMESFTKVLNDPKGKYVQDAERFIGSRVTQYFNMGLGMYEQKNFEMAFMSFAGAYQVKQFLGQEYEDAKVNAMATYRYVADSLVRAEELSKAEELTNVANDLFPNDMTVLTNYINIALKSGDTEKSEKYIKEALELDPNNKQLYYILGTSFIELKQNEKAESNLLKAIEIDPEYVNAHSNLAALYMDWSIAIGDEARDLDYRDPRVNELEDQKKQLLTKAIPSLEKMIVAFPDNKSVMKNLAMAYRASGNEEKFKEWYDKSKN
jgi:tetratricopeptide (TPR) repeat protein